MLSAATAASDAAIAIRLPVQGRPVCSARSTGVRADGRGTEADFARFLQMAMGSACELEYQLLLSKDLCYISEVTHQQLEVAVVEVKRMLTAFIQKLRVAS